MTNEQMQRINDLAKKSKVEQLSENEIAEQQELRQLYINQVKANMKSVLNNTVIQNPDGSKHSLKHNPDKKEKH